MDSDRGTMDLAREIIDPESESPSAALRGPPR